MWSLPWRLSLPPTVASQRVQNADQCCSAYRQKSVLYRTNELEELEARIREAEERLRRSQLPSTFAGPAPSRGPPPRSSARQHAASIFSSRAEEKPQPAQSPQQKPEQQQQQRRDRATSNSATSSKHGSRPGTARAGKNLPGGAMPPTPTASEGTLSSSFPNFLPDVRVGGRGL